MASIQKIERGYRAQVKIKLPGAEKPTRDSEVFPTKREAVEWAARRETEIRSALDKPKLLGEIKTLRDAMRRYADEVCPTKKGERWEQIRLAAFEGYKLPSNKPILHVTAQDIADFRDDRLKTLRPNSVRREITLLSSVFEMSRIEWGYVDINPCGNIRKPPKGKHRQRVITWSEIRLMLREMNYQVHQRPQTVGQCVAVCMVVALRTGMRAGEMTGMGWSQVFDRYCNLPDTKTGRERNVPLSKKAKRSIESMRGWDDLLVFGLGAGTLDALFRKYRKRAGLDGFTFHDNRHTAATMISKKMDVLDLCKMFGWSDPKMAMVYYNPTSDAIADLLD